MISTLYYDVGFIVFLNYNKIENTKLFLELIDLVSDLF